MKPSVRKKLAILWLIVLKLKYIIMPTKISYVNETNEKPFSIKTYIYCKSDCLKYFFKTLPFHFAPQQIQDRIVPLIQGDGWSALSAMLNTLKKMTVNALIWTLWWNYSFCQIVCAFYYPTHSFPHTSTSFCMANSNSKRIYEEDFGSEFEQIFD